MAEQQLNIKLNVIDNATQAFKSVRDSIFNLRNALLGVGAGAVVKSILNVGSQAQQLRNQFLLLAPSVEEGRKSFEALQRFTATSPLQSDSIERASEIVIAFSKNSKDLTDNLFAIQNAAITLGIDIETVAREFSTLSRTGIDGARELKRRNLEAFLGLSSGIKVSSDEIVRKFLETFGANGKFALASEVFGNTFVGASNRFKNSIRQIQESIAQAGVLDYFTAFTNVVSNFIKDNPDALKKIIDDFAKGLIEGTQLLFSFGSRFINVFGTIFKLVGDGIDGLNKAVEVITKDPVIKEIGLVGFLLLGKKGKIIALLLGGIFKVVDGLLDKFAGINQEIADQENKTTNLGGLYEKIQDELNRIKDLQEKFNSELEKTKGKANDVSNIFEKIFRNVYTLNENNIAGFLKVEDVATSINKVFGDFSKSIAEIIVLGKSVTTTFKEFLQGILVQIVASSIEYLLRLYIIKPILESIFGIQKNQTEEQVKQTSILSAILGINYVDLDIHNQKTDAIDRQNSALERQLTLENGIAGARAAQSSYGGGGGGGGLDLGTIFNIGSSIFGFAEGGNMKAGNPYIVGERGRELFIPKTDGTIIPNQDLMGQTNISFTINATDVKGVQELLINNRATITNLINQALNQRGKANLI